VAPLLAKALGQGLWGSKMDFGRGPGRTRSAIQNAIQEMHKQGTHSHNGAHAKVRLEKFSLEMKQGVFQNL